MSANAAQPVLSPDWPTTLFNLRGDSCRVETPAEYDRLISQGWLKEYVAPPEPEPPMSPEEREALRADYVEGLGDQVDSQAVIIRTLEERVTRLERIDIASLEANAKGLLLNLESQTAMEARVKHLEESISNARVFFDQIERRQTVLERKEGKK